MLKRQFIQSVIGLAILATSSLALSNTEFTYNLIDDGIEITGHTCSSNYNVIPEFIDGYSVKAIGDFAFENTGILMDILSRSPINACFNVVQTFNSLTIPDSVTHIGFNAFSNNSLVNLTIGNNVKTIAIGAFSGNKLTNLVIPSSVENIGLWAFLSNSLVSLSFLGDRPELPALGSQIIYTDNSCYQTEPFSLLPGLELLAQDSCSQSVENFVASSDDNGRPIYQEPSSINVIPSLKAIYYCSNTTGWPGQNIEGVIPESRNCESILWDFDKNGNVDALTDGLLLFRYNFGLRGENLSNRAIGLDSMLVPNDVETNIEQAIVNADMDSNGSIDALTDSLLLLRYFFGLRGEDLIADVLAEDANRTSAAEIEAYIESHMTLNVPPQNQ